jgi:hypothetical protein
MIVHLIDLKSEMIKENLTYMDFLENNFKVNYMDPDLQIQKVFFIEERHLCRPDLLSWDAYYSVDYVDVILKFNQITNPFSMELYDFIVVPDLPSAQRFYQKQTLKSSKEIRDTKALFIDPSKASKKDLARLEQLKKIAARRQNGSTEIKPTNLLRNGEVPFATDGKSIIFAPSMSSTSKNSQAITK